MEKLEEEIELILYVERRIPEDFSASKAEHE